MTWNLREDLNTFIVLPNYQNTSYIQRFCNLLRSFIKKINKRQNLNIKQRSKEIT